MAWMSDGRVGHMEEIKLTLLFDISGSLQQKNLFLDLKKYFPQLYQHRQNCFGQWRTASSGKGGGNVSTGQGD